MKDRKQNKTIDCLAVACAALLMMTSSLGFAAEDEGKKEIIPKGDSF